MSVGHYGSGCGYRPISHCDAQQRLTSNCQRLHPCWRERGLFLAAEVLSAHMWLAGNCRRINNPLPTAPSGCSSQLLTLRGWCINIHGSFPLGWDYRGVGSMVLSLSSSWAVTCLIRLLPLATALPYLTSLLPQCMLPIPQ